MAPSRNVDNEMTPLLKTQNRDPPNGASTPIVAKKAAANWHLIATVSIVSFASGIQFYNAAVVNNLQSVALPWINYTLQTRYGYTDVTSFDVTGGWSLVSGFDRLGSLVGFFFVRICAERLGRRGSLLLSCSITIGGAILCMCAKVANSLEILLLGRLMLGYSTGFGFAIGGMFLTEIAPACYRGICGGAMQVFIGGSEFLAAMFGLPQILGTPDLWPIGFGLAAIPATVELLFLLFVARHESPKYLYLTKHEEEKALSSILFYQMVETRISSPTVDETMEELRTEATKAQTRELKGRQHVRMIDLLLHREYRMPFLISLAVLVAMPLSGRGLILFFSTDLILSTTSSTVEFAKYFTVALGLVTLGSSLVGLSLIERIGRKPLYLLYLFGCATSLTVMAIFSSFTFLWSDILTLIALGAYPIMYGIGTVPSTVIIVELFDTHVRSLVLSIAYFSLCLFSAIVAFTYLPWKLAVGASASLVPFAVCTFLFGIFIAIAMPETKGRKVEDVGDSTIIDNNSMCSSVFD